MRLFMTMCVLVLLCYCVQSEDLIFFADDYYKVIGSPDLNLTADRYEIGVGKSILEVHLQNHGGVSEIIPLSSNGSQLDLDLELKDEMNCTNAQNLRVNLEGSGPISVEAYSQIIGDLPSGESLDLVFNITAKSNATGWYELPLFLEYERQADVSVLDGISTPLMLPVNKSLFIWVFVSQNRNQNETRSLHLLPDSFFPSGFSISVILAFITFLFAIYGAILFATWLCNRLRIKRIR